MDDLGKALEEIGARVTRGKETVADIQATMDGHYKVIREHLGAERGPGFAHRVNSLLLRVSGQLVQIDQNLARAWQALASTPASSPYLSTRSDDDLHTMRNRIDKEFARRGIVAGKDGTSSPPLITEKMKEAALDEMVVIASEDDDLTQPASGDWRTEPNADDLRAWMTRVLTAALASPEEGDIISPEERA